MKTNHIFSFAKNRILLVARLIIALLLLGAMDGCSSNSTDSSVRTHTLIEPLGDATAAKFDVHTGTGNLTIDRLTGGEPLLAGGSLEYLESQGPPDRTLVAFAGQATLTLKAVGAKQAGSLLPWEACNGATTWQIHLNPGLPSDITAYSGGGNVRLDLAGLAITHVNAETSGGNMDVILPDHTASLSVKAKSGAGNVTVELGSGIRGSHTIRASSGAGNVVVRLPGGVAARIHADSGTPIMDPRFSQVDQKTYQSPDYDSAADKVEITLDSGLGNVTVEPKL